MRVWILTEVISINDNGLLGMALVFPENRANMFL
jgi:hypothetical protein